MTFQRNDRVVLIRDYDRYALRGATGTVTHLDGDGPVAAHPDGFNNAGDDDVWVCFDNGHEVWVEVEYLAHA